MKEEERSNTEFLRVFKGLNVVIFGIPIS